MAATFSRILISPFFLVALYIGVDHPYMAWSCAIIFAVGSFTDWLDGYWARKYNAESTMGKFMDPIADKILVLAALLALLQLGRVDPYMVYILLARDLWIGGLRSVAAAHQTIISAKAFGKWKTAIQMVCIPCLFLKDELPQLPLEEIGYWGLWISVILSLISGVQYSYAYLKNRNN